MKNFNFKFALSSIALTSIMMAATTAKAAPVQFNQVVQMVNAKPGKANAAGFTQLHLVGDEPIIKGDDETKKPAPQPQDGRVITEIRSEIVEDDVCDCAAVPLVAKGFPYGWLALGGVPLLFLVPNGDDKTPTPTPSAPETPPTTPQTPTPSEPVPEPMTILLFGTGLASIGLAARRKFGKKDDEETNAV